MRENEENSSGLNFGRAEGLWGVSPPQLGRLKSRVSVQEMGGERW